MPLVERIMPTRALLVIDVQNDFLPGGALPVPRGDEVVAVANRVMPLFEVVIATQDWHPADHVSFAVNHVGRTCGESVRTAGGQLQRLWPVHCVPDSHGAALCPDLDVSRVTHFVRKGVETHVDSYSAFFDNEQGHPTGLEEVLRTAGVTDLFLLGLATDYCVAATARDALRLGFHVWIITDGCRGIDPGSVKQVLDDLKALGVEFTASDQLPALLRQ